MTDPINPSHYKHSKVECIDAIEAAVEDLSGFEGMCTGNAIKYLFRWRKKHGDTKSQHDDLRKARYYINRLLGEE